MTALAGSAGSSTPSARPRSRSYAPTAPKLAPPNAGSLERISILMIFAAAGEAAKHSAQAAATAIDRDIRILPCEEQRAFVGFVADFVAPGRASGTYPAGGFSTPSLASLG